MNTQKAVDKVKTEMKKGNTYVKYIGQYLLARLETNPDEAEKILQPEKTITKSLEVMRKVAEKKKVGNMAMLTPEEGFKVIADYFGINGSIEPVDVNYSAVQQPQANNNSTFVITKIEME